MNYSIVQITDHIFNSAKQKSQIFKSQLKGNHKLPLCLFLWMRYTPSGIRQQKLEIKIMIPRFNIPYSKITIDDKSQMKNHKLQNYIYKITNDKL